MYPILGPEEKEATTCSCLNELLLDIRPLRQLYSGLTMARGSSLPGEAKPSSVIGVASSVMVSGDLYSRYVSKGRLLLLLYSFVPGGYSASQN